jgi:hypothetical protein
VAEGRGEVTNFIHCVFTNNIHTLAGEGKLFFCINGFYLHMREMFTKPGARIKWFSVTFPTSLSWKDFRTKVSEGHEGGRGRG